MIDYLEKLNEGSVTLIGNYYLNEKYDKNILLKFGSNCIIIKIFLKSLRTLMKIIKLKLRKGYYCTKIDIY